MRKSLLKNAFLFVSVCLMMPLLSFSQFVENNGQIAHREISKLRPDIKFQVKGNEVISNYKADGIENYYCKVREVQRENWTDDMKENERMDRKVRSFQDIFFYRFDVAFIGSNPDVNMEPSDKSKTYRNYYYEFCPDGILNVPEYKTIEYQDLYPGIDLRYVGTDKGIKYEFILAKGAKISDIKMKYIGVDGLNVEENGDLTYSIDGKKMTEKSPFTFYSGSGKEISSAYTIVQHDIIQFKVDGIDEVTEEITIDPILTWSTYFQGVYGGYQGDPGVDNQGNIYICTQEGAGTLPVLNAGAGQWYQGTTTGPSPNWDLAIFKFNSDLSLAWCTFYGGQGCEQGWGKRNVAIDNTNNRIYFSGETDTPYSNSVQTFPTYNPGGGAFYQGTSYDNGSSYPFFIEFTPAGVRNWATLFTYETAPFSGGMGTDVESIYFRNGYLYFSGETNKYSHSGIPLRTLAGAYNNSYWPGDGSHIYCGRFNSSRTLEWCTYVNNNVATTSFSSNLADMVVDANNNIYLVTDYSEYSASKLSTILPLVNPGAGAYYQATGGLGYGSRRGTHITKLNPSSSVPLWGTFYNGSYGDLPGVCEVDASNNLYVGWRSTGSTDFPCYNPGSGAYYQSTKRSVCNTGPNDYANGGKDGAVAKFTSAGVRLWATYINGTTPTSGETGVNDIDTYPTGEMMMSSKTVCPDFPVQNLSGSYYKSTITTPGTYENIFTKFSSGGVILWSSYFQPLMGYGAIQNNNCVSKYFVDNGGGSTIPLVNPGAPAYYSSTTQNYQSFQLFEDATSNQSTPASSISASPTTTICNGGSVTLTVQGGSLGSGASWQWFSGSCGGTFVGSGASVSVSPTSNTNYYVRATGVCNTTSCVSLLVTVTPNNTISLSAGGTQTKCINTAITTTTYATTGATGATITGLPTGVTGSWASNTVTISGTPTAAGTYTYTVTLTGGCGTITTTGIITVTPNNTITLTSGNNTQTRCINSAIANITYTSAGATGATFSGLPAGVSGSYSGGNITITGTPTVSGTFNYTATLTGGCGTASATGTITVTPNNTITLSSGNNTQTRCINSAIANISYTSTGATGATFSGLPAGVSGSYSGGNITISGTPSASGTFNYTVTLTGGCGTVSATGIITVTPNNTITLISGSTNQTRCVNTAIASITYTSTGSTNATFSGLPAGVSGSYSGGNITISGTPTSSGVYNYTITLTGGCGTTTANGTITVTPNNTISLTVGGTQTRCVNTAITTTTYVTTGATGASVTGLPAGVTGSWASNTVTISGTPTNAGAYTYTVTLTGGCGTIATTGTITVTPNNTIALTSGNNTQTRCVNTAIANITYTSTGATGATFSGLPAGVSGSYSGGNITITGTPTVSGTFNYTAALTGGCGTVSATGTITVTPNNTITLTSGNNVQTRCINTAITGITYTSTGATNATYSGLPAGVSGSYSGGNITISGTPTTSGVFNYTVTLTGGCGTVSANGTITVTPGNTLSLTAGGTQTKCINTAITTTTYSTTGATGATITGLPAGVTGGWASNTVSISGTPTASGIYTYTVTLTGGCGTTEASGTITVTPTNTITLINGGTQTSCVNTAITATTYSTTGATGAAYSGLPTGVTGSWASNVVTISGTPTVTGSYTYTVTLTGGCGTVTTTGIITVSQNNTISLSSAAGTNAQTQCVNTAITNITYATSGATGAIVTGLPTGINGNWASNTVTISGSSMVSGTYTYSVTTTGGCGTATTTGTITVNTANTITLIAGGTQTLCVNTPISSVTYSTTGATGATFSGLPSGVTGYWSSNVVIISGTPIVSGTYNYTVTLTGGCGTATANGTITVTPINTITLIAGAPQTRCINTAINNITYSTTGATGASVTGLPAGVTGSWTSNVVVISGTPSVSGTYTYTITLTGGCGSVTSTQIITVTPNSTVTLSSAPGTASQNICNNTAITNITYATTTATGATVTGLPSGVTGSWASNVVTISGTPTAPGTYTYTVGLTGGCGTATATGTLTVIPVNTITLTAGGTQTKCINTAINTTTYTTTGATGATVTGLPAGVTGSWASNVVTITGIPTVAGVFTYTIALPGGCGVSTATGTITVTPDNTLTLSSGAGTNAQNVCINAPITNITYASAVATGAIVSGLPLGVTGSWASNVVTISGTPTVTGAYTYTVTTTGGCQTATATGTIVVNVNKTADVSLQAIDNPACSHTLVTFTATPVNGGLSPAYQWYVNSVPVGGNSSTYSNISLNNADAVVCRLTSNEFCAINNPAYDTVIMIVNPIPIAEAGATATYTGTPIQIGDPLNGPGTINWSPAAGLNNTWVAQPLASPSVTTTYTLTVNNNGCIHTDTVTVHFGGVGYAISGKTRYLKKAIAGTPVPTPPSYNAVIYNINNVEVKLKTSPGGAVIATTMSDANGVYQFANVPNGNYILSYDHIPYDTMQFVNQVNAVDLALLKYLIGHDTLIDPSRSFTAKHKKAGNVDNNTSINTVDIARISAKVGLPYTPSRNFPKGNWVALDTSVTVAGANLNVTLQTVSYGDYDASSAQYKDSLTNWGMAKVLPDENIINRSAESITINNNGYFEVPLRISTKMNEISALGLELSYLNDKYKLVSASMVNTRKNNGTVKINPSLEEIIADNNDLLVTDMDGIIRVVFATTNHFDIAANEEIIRLGFRSLKTLNPGELEFNLSGTGVIANQYGQENDDTYLLMPKIFVQGNNSDAGFEFAGYPNPFNSDATLTYFIPENGTVKLNVYSAIGELVSELVNEAQISGKHSVDFLQQDLPAGMYTFKLEFTGSDKSKCMVLKMIH